jgi:hypothetical protein
MCIKQQGNSHHKQLILKRRGKWDDNINVERYEIEFTNVDSVELIQDPVVLGGDKFRVLLSEG